VSNRKFTLQCERIVADEPNHNGNIYPESVLRQMVDQAQERVRSHRLMGRLGTSIDRVRIMDASHIVTALRYVAPHIEADIEVLNTEKGNELLTLLESFGPVYYEVIPYGTGTVTARDANTRVVGDDYKLSALDVVPKLKRGASEAAIGPDARSAQDEEGGGRLRELQAEGAGSEAAMPQGTVFTVIQWFGHVSDGEGACLGVFNTHAKAKAFCESYDTWDPDFCDPETNAWSTEYFTIQIEQHEIE
jgi:hypothetical protein